MRTSLTVMTFALVAALGSTACLEPFPPASQPTGQPGKVTPAAKHGAPPPTDGYLAGAHILIAYEGAQRSKATRSKAEALALARKIAATLQGKVNEETFAALARKHSDGPSGPRGGSLGTWKKGQMVPAFDAAILTLPINGVTREPVETPFGFHLIMRHAVLPNIKIAATQILISHEGALRAPAAITRDAAQALVLCQKVAKLAAGSDAAGFAKLAATYSDDKTPGGRMGSWSVRESPLPASINRAVYALKIGATSGPVRSPLGCHVFRRVAPTSD